MATVKPFNGITFDPIRVPDLSQVTCPPYDVISDADRDELYERHPYNIVRIVSGRSESKDNDDENKYSRACGFFRSWLWEGVLREDTRPALYVYRQAFDDPSGALRRVWGLLGAISLDDEILAHERTMPGPKADRLALMRAVPANLSPIYALYREEGGGVSAELSSWSREPPVADFTDDAGTRHTAWAVHDEAFHEKVAAALTPCPLLIADGHHRFETAKAYRDERDGHGPWDSTLALLVDAGEQPVLILPYHRIVRRIGPSDPLDVLAANFDIQSVGEPTADKVSEVANWQWTGEGRSGFVLVLRNGLHVLRPRTEHADDVPAGILAREALEPLEVGDAEEALTFTPDELSVAEEITSGRAACGFLIPPVDVDPVWVLASSGAKMPEKSTYFYPKPRDGIVVRALEPCAPDLPR